MSRVRLYIAASVDGFIATKDGGVDWLQPFTPSEVEQSNQVSEPTSQASNKTTQDMYGFHSFLAEIGTVVMGSRTYLQVLDFGSWPYQGKKAIVFSRKKLPVAPKADVLFLKTLSRQAVFTNAVKDTDIWLVGGGKTIQGFLQQDLLDEIQLFVMPVFLREGVQLVDSLPNQHQLKLKRSNNYHNGVVELVYSVKR